MGGSGEAVLGGRAMSGGLLFAKDVAFVAPLAGV